MRAESFATLPRTPDGRDPAARERFARAAKPHHPSSVARPGSQPGPKSPVGQGSAAGNRSISSASDAGSRSSVRRSTSPTARDSERRRCPPSPAGAQHPGQHRRAGATRADPGHELLDSEVCASGAAPGTFSPRRRRWPRGGAATRSRVMPPVRSLYRMDEQTRKTMPFLGQWGRNSRSTFGPGSPAGRLERGRSGIEARSSELARAWARWSARPPGSESSPLPPPGCGHHPRPFSEPVRTWSRRRVSSHVSG